MRGMVIYMKKRITCSFLVIVMIMTLMAGIVPVNAAARKIQVQTISTSIKHSAVIKTDGSLWTWGENYSGQLGDGTNINRKIMVKIMDNAAAVSAGGSFTAAIKTDGSLWTWGYNGYGQLGDGTNTKRYKPVKVMDNVAAVCAGDSHTAAIKTDGSLWTWGNNGYGQLGNGTTDPTGTKGYKPVKVMDNVAAVSLGANHTAAIKTDGSLWMWGWNDYGQLGDYINIGYSQNTIRNKPKKVMDNVASVSAGGSYTAAVKTDGSLWMWGSNRSGQLGDGTKNDRNTLFKVMDDVAAVSAGDYQMNAIKKDGSLWTWGKNMVGQLGDGTSRDRYTPAKIMDDVTAVSGDFEHNIAVKTDGSLWAWGLNYYSNPIESLVPTKILENVALANPVLQKTLPSTSLESIKVLLNNNPITFNQPPVIKDGQVFVPYREIFESMGATAEWNGATGLITAKKGAINITMQKDYCIMYRNEQIFINTAAPQMINNQIYVPLRAVAENLSADYDWHENTQTANINTVWNENLTNMVSKNMHVTYEEKMKTFGLDKLYNNERAETSEPVTKAEALKLALAVVFNTTDISGFAAEHNEYKNAIWVEYAKATGITKEDINISNYNEKASYLDVISYFENCKIKFLKDYSIKDTIVNFKDISNYSTEQQAAIKDMVANGIIYPLSDNLNGSARIFKGQLNELVVNFAEKYSTIAMMGDRINLDPQKLPANADQYPYTITTVDKAIYEIPFIKEYSVRFLTPKESYTKRKENYTLAKEWSEEFFNNILNIDYKTITEESLYEKLRPYLIFSPNKSAIASYVKYVKANEIVIEGSSKLQVPIIYFDGDTYRGRLKLNFEIKHSKTKVNLLYLDLFDGLKKTYGKNSYDILADYYLESALGTNTFYMEEADLYRTILQKDKCGITKEIEK